MAKIDLSKVGADRTFQNAREAERAKNGKYEDLSRKVTEDDAWALKANPKGVGPQPLKTVRHFRGERQGGG